MNIFHIASMLLSLAVAQDTLQSCGSDIGMKNISYTGFNVAPYNYPYTDTKAIDNDPNWFTTGYKSYGLTNYSDYEAKTLIEISQTAYWLHGWDLKPVYAMFYGYRIPVRNSTFEYTAYYYPHESGTYTFTLTTNGPVGMTMGFANTTCFKGIEKALTNNTQIGVLQRNGKYKLTYKAKLNARQLYPLKMVYTQPGTPNSVFSFDFDVIAPLPIPFQLEELWRAYQIDDGSRRLGNFTTTLSTGINSWTTNGQVVSSTLTGPITETGFRYSTNDTNGSGYITYSIYPTETTSTSSTTTEATTTSTSSTTTEAATTSSTAAEATTTSTTSSTTPEATTSTTSTSSTTPATTTLTSTTATGATLSDYPAELYTPKACGGSKSAADSTGEGFLMVPYHYSVEDNDKLTDPSWYYDGYTKYAPYKPSELNPSLSDYDVYPYIQTQSTSADNDPNRWTWGFKYIIPSASATIEFTAYYMSKTGGNHTLTFKSGGPAGLMFGKGDGACYCGVNNAVDKNVNIAYQNIKDISIGDNTPNTGTWITKKYVTVEAGKFYPIKYVYTQPSNFPYPQKFPNSRYYLFYAVGDYEKHTMVDWDLYQFSGCSDEGTDASTTGPYTVAQSGNFTTTPSTGVISWTNNGQVTSSTLTGPITETGTWYTTSDSNGKPYETYSIYPTETTSTPSTTSTTTTSSTTTPSTTTTGATLRPYPAELYTPKACGGSKSAADSTGEGFLMVPYHYSVEDNDKLTDPSWYYDGYTKYAPYKPSELNPSLSDYDVYPYIQTQSTSADNDPNRWTWGFKYIIPSASATIEFTAYYMSKESGDHTLLFKSGGPAGLMFGKGDNDCFCGVSNSVDKNVNIAYQDIYDLNLDNTRAGTGMWITKKYVTVEAGKFYPIKYVYTQPSNFPYPKKFPNSRYYLFYAFGDYHTKGMVNSDLYQFSGCSIDNTTTTGPYTIHSGNFTTTPSTGIISWTTNGQVTSSTLTGPITETGTWYTTSDSNGKPYETYSIYPTETTSTPSTTSTTTTPTTTSTTTPSTTSTTSTSSTTTPSTTTTGATLRPYPAELYTPKACGGSKSAGDSTGEGFLMVPYHYSVEDNDKLTDPSWYYDGYTKYAPYKPSELNPSLSDYDVYPYIQTQSTSADNDPNRWTWGFKYIIPSASATIEFTAYYMSKESGDHTLIFKSGGPAGLMFGKGDGACYCGVNNAIDKNVNIAYQDIYDQSLSNTQAGTGMWITKKYVTVEAGKFYPIKYVYTQPSNFPYPQKFPNSRYYLYYAFGDYHKLTMVNSDLYQFSGCSSEGSTTSASTTGPYTVAHSGNFTTTPSTGVISWTTDGTVTSSTLTGPITETGTWYTTTDGNGKPYETYSIYPTEVHHSGNFTTTPSTGVISWTTDGTVTSSTLTGPITETGTWYTTTGADGKPTETYSIYPTEVHHSGNFTTTPSTGVISWTTDGTVTSSTLTGPITETGTWYTTTDGNGKSTETYSIYPTEVHHSGNFTTTPSTGVISWTTDSTVTSSTLTGPITETGTWYTTTDGNGKSTETYSIYPTEVHHSGNFTTTPSTGVISWSTDGTVISSTLTGPITETGTWYTTTDANGRSTETYSIYPTSVVPVVSTHSSAVVVSSTVASGTSVPVTVVSSVTSSSNVPVSFTSTVLSTSTGVSVSIISSGVPVTSVGSSVSHVSTVSTFVSTYTSESVGVSTVTSLSTASSEVVSSSAVTSSTTVPVSSTGVSSVVSTISSGPIWSTIVSTSTYTSVSTESAVPNTSFSSAVISSDHVVSFTSTYVSTTTGVTSIETDTSVPVTVVSSSAVVSSSLVPVSSVVTSESTGVSTVASETVVPVTTVSHSAVSSDVVVSSTSVSSGLSTVEPTQATEHETVVSTLTVPCTGPTTLVTNGATYTATEATILTITDCPCTHTIKGSSPVESVSSTHVAPVSSETSSSEAHAAPTSSSSGASTHATSGTDESSSDSHAAPAASESASSETHTAPAAGESASGASTHAAPAVSESASSESHAAPAASESTSAASTHAAPAASETASSESHAAPAASTPAAPAANESASSATAPAAPAASATASSESHTAPAASQSAPAASSVSAHPVESSQTSGAWSSNSSSHASAGTSASTSSPNVAPGIVSGSSTAPLPNGVGKHTFSAVAAVLAIVALVI